MPTIVSSQMSRWANHSYANVAIKKRLLFRWNRSLNQWSMHVWMVHRTACVQHIVTLQQMHEIQANFRRTIFICSTFHQSGVPICKQSRWLPSPFYTHHISYYQEKMGTSVTKSIHVVNTCYCFGTEMDSLWIAYMDVLFGIFRSLLIKSWDQIKVSTYPSLIQYIRNSHKLNLMDFEFDCING